ncbi:MAG: hypothetical protein WBP81_38340 [Solirubrobacteraceae bacterium]
MATPGELRESWSGACGPPDWETVLGDGIALQHEIGFAGDHRFIYGSDAFLITPDARTVLCSVEHPDDVRWQRQLLDTILFSVSFANGFELVHASAVEVGDGVVAFVAPSGGGKSSIAAELGRRGYRIFCDDVLTIGQCGKELLCHPGPAVMSIPSSAGPVASLGANVITMFADEDELWVELDHAAASPGALRAVYLLDRYADSCFVSKIAAPTLLNLLPHAISLPHDAARARSRFELFSALAEQIEMFELAANSSASTSTLADLVEMSPEDLRSRLAFR